MRYRYAVFALALILMPSVGSATEPDSADALIVHGTINIAFGNMNGLVLLTDSMLSAGSRQLQGPGEKLFKLDDHTVCSFAGIASAPASVPELSLSASSIIHEYARQSATQAPQTIAEKLRALASLFDVHLSAIAILRDATGVPVRIEDYRLQIIVAGYDLDGKPKIGKVTFRTDRSPGGALSAAVDDAGIIEVGDKLVWKLNGMPDVAERLLANPASDSSHDSALGEYALSIQLDKGASLSIEQMVKLAKRLAFYTAQAHPEVGGPNQIAILTPSSPMKIDQPTFSPPPRLLFSFGIIVDSRFSHSSIVMAPGSHGVFVRCVWTGMERELDGNYFIRNTFTDSVLVSRGGRTSLGNGTNRIVNSVLLIAPLVDPKNENVGLLSRSFPWTRIQWGFSGPARQ
jgi:20S proteasome alpha/beta subunit